MIFKRMYLSNEKNHWFIKILKIMVNGIINIKILKNLKNYYSFWNKKEERKFYSLVYDVLYPLVLQS